MKKRNVALLSLLLLNSPQLIADDNTVTTRIVGGKQSLENSWPWIVSINNAGHFTCGGTLISPDIVLTAAHCFYDDKDNQVHASDITVQVGAYDKGAYPATPKTNVSQIDIHTNYDKESNANDIALLHLTSVIADVTPIELVDINSTTAAILAQDNVTAMGWGSTVAYTPNSKLPASFPEVLREVEVPLQTDEQCSEHLGSNYQASSMLCAAPSTGGKDACQGDSGGPLVYKQDGNWKQIGIVSWGNGCATAGYPGVYTRLANYTDWIAKITTNLSFDNQLSYPNTLVNEVSEQTLSITNNAQEAAQVSFSLIGSPQFSFEQGACTSIAPQTSCSLTITYAPEIVELSEATLQVSNNLNNISISTTFSAVSLTDISAVATQAGFANVPWSTGGDAVWERQADSNILQTKNISHEEETVLAGSFTGQGRLDFHWAVDSEFDYDFLSLFINGEKVDDISGTTIFKHHSYFLSGDQNSVVWQYKKDIFYSSGLDQAFLRQVSFVNMTKAEYDLQIASEINTSGIVDEVIDEAGDGATNETIDEVIDEAVDEIIDEAVDDIIKESTGGGGSSSWLFSLFIPALLLRRFLQK